VFASVKRYFFGSTAIDVAGMTIVFGGRVDGDMTDVAAAGLRGPTAARSTIEPGSDVHA
jgi:hypothetical protein